MSRNVGIIAMEIVFPRVYVSQEELEIYDKVLKGKYTIGLGQQNMSFTEPHEDVNSLALTAVKQLLEKNHIPPKQIGRLEVGTETLVDRSKSTKTVLMDLFAGNFDIEGVTTLNACYGGTSALFSAFDWIQSSSWDGRYAVVVCVDIAVYTKGPARPTGGAGAVAMLIGPDAQLVAEPMRASYSTNAYDFYKPNPKSEYPTVDGQLSIKLYLEAIDSCYRLLQRKIKQKYGRSLRLDQLDYLCFHSPFGKMVQKSFNRIFMLDLVDRNRAPDEKANAQECAMLFQQKVYPSTTAARQLGNIYTGSLYSGLASLIESKELQGCTVALFSYGSGLAASLFLLRGNTSTRRMGESIGLSERLGMRIKVPPQEYDQIMSDRERFYGTREFFKEVNTDRLFPGAYYIKSVDEKWRRTYERYQPNQIKANSTINMVETNSTSNMVETNSSINMVERNSPSVTFENQIDVVKRMSTIRNQIVQYKKTDLLDEKTQYNKLWSGFYKKTVQQRQDQLQTVLQLNVEQLKTGGLTLSRADHMIENCIGMVGLPVGLALHFLINGKFYNVPMAIEEPSVVAAASSAAKLIADAGKGFTAHSSRSIMVGQVHLVDVEDPQLVRCIIDQHKLQIIECANEVAVNMVKRGGGTEDVRARLLPNNQISVDVYINVCESMGANLVNSVVEHISSYIEQITGCRAGIRVLTNLCEERRVSGRFEVEVQKMGWKGVPGEKVCALIMEAHRFAQNDVHRAVTHNKGILNGIQAVALASGQDIRAISASLHAWAARSGTYQPLNQYEIHGNYFIGTMCVPIAVGTQGGAIPSNPIYSTVMDILGQPRANQLAEIMVCAGMACNLAALRALCVEGIQKGHMSLHARNLALAAGVPSELVEEAVRFMKNRGNIGKETAQEFLNAYCIYREVRRDESRQPLPATVLSTFSGEFHFEGLSERLDLHVVLNCGSDVPYHTSFTEREPAEGKALIHYIFGANLEYNWINKWFSMLSMVRLNQYLEKPLPNQSQVYKLKLLAILINLIVYKLLERNFTVSAAVVCEILKQGIKDCHYLFEGQVVELKYGLSLLCELVRIFKYSIEQSITDQGLQKMLWSQLMDILFQHIRAFTLWNDATNSIFQIEEFMAARQKRLSFTMMLFCDALNFNQVQLTPEFLGQLQILGDIQEKESTVIRDLYKWNQSSLLSSPNLYIYWLMMNNKLSHAEQPLLKQQFLDEITVLMDHSRQLVSKLSPELMALKTKATFVAKSYYNEEQSKI